MKFLLAMLLTLLAAPVAWGQGNKPNTLAELVKYKGADRERVLYEGAKKEGKLVWYTSLVPNKHIAKIFEAKYPGISVNIYRAAGNTLATRLLEERNAKRYVADAIESTPPQLMLLRDAQALQPFTSLHLANYPDIAKETVSGGLVLWVTDRESLIGVGYNKNVMKGGFIPKKFDDLLNPALKGQMSSANNETGARARLARCSRRKARHSYGNSESRSSCARVWSVFTLPFEKRGMKCSTTLSVSSRPFVG